MNRNCPSPHPTAFGDSHLWTVSGDSATCDGCGETRPLNRESALAPRRKNWELEVIRSAPEDILDEDGNPAV